MFKYLLFLLVPFSLFAQEPSQPKVDKEVDSLLLECRRFSRQPDSLIIRANQLLKIGRDNNLEEVIIEGYFAKGYANYGKSSFDQAIIYFDSAETVINSDSITYYKSLSRILNTRAIAAHNIGDLRSTRRDFNRLIGLAKAFNNHRSLATAYNHLGVLERKEGRFDEAIDYYSKSLKIWDSLGVDKKRFYTFTSLGTAHGQLKQFEQGLKHLKIALDIAMRNNMTLETNRGYNNLSVAFRQMEMYDSAIWCLNKILPYYHMGGFAKEEIQTYQNMAHNQMLLGQYDSAKVLLNRAVLGCDSIELIPSEIEVNRLLGDLNYRTELFDSAIFFYDKALNLATKHNFKIQYLSIYQGVADSYEKKGDYKLANKFLHYKDQIKDSTYTTSGLRTLNEILTKYEVGKKNEQIDSLNKKKSFYQSIIWPSILGLLVLVLLAFYLYKRLYSTQKDVLLRDDELVSLRSELDKIKSGQSKSKTEEAPLIHLKSKAVLSPNELMYIKSDTHYLEFYMKDKNKPEIDRTTFKEIESLLPKGQFVRVHRSFLVNIHFIKIINSTQLMLENGDWINLSRTYKPMLKEMIRSGSKR